jgi:hypothetical protein
MIMEKMKETEERDGDPPLIAREAPFSLMFLFCSDDQEDTPFGALCSSSISSSRSP